MRALRGICGNMLKDEIRNEFIPKDLEVASAGDG